MSPNDATAWYRTTQQGVVRYMALGRKRVVESRMIWVTCCLEWGVLLLGVAWVLFLVGWVLGWWR